MKKILLFGICTFLLMVTNVQADVTATLVGRNYGTGEIDTSVDVGNAYLKLYPLHPIVNQSTNPTISWMKGSSNGLSRMENSILFFSGHGNSSLMHFYNSDSSDSSYDFYIKATNNTSNTVGLGSYDMSKVKLVVFAGCQTAYGTNNITKTVYNNGAKGTLGWSTSINASAHTAWLTNFWTKIGAGNSLAQAVASANSVSYTDNRVKNAVYYGGNYIGFGGMGDYILQSRTNVLNTAIEQPVYLINKEIDDDNEYDEMIDIINDKFNTNLESENFIITKSISNENDIYDYMYSIDKKIKTTIGYTFFVKNGVIDTVYDNTKNLDYDTLKEQFFEKYNNINIDELNRELPNESSYLYYDYENNQLYKVIVNEILDEMGAQSLTDEFIEVN